MVDAALTYHNSLSNPSPQRIEGLFTKYWTELSTLPPLTHTNENLLAEALTTRLRDLVIEMMLALNGIAYPQNTSNLNAYLGDSQREAIEKTLLAKTTGPDAWIARAVALTVIYQWYAPQLVDKYGLDYPHELEQAVRAKLIAELPQWPQSITSE